MSKVMKFRFNVGDVFENKGFRCTILEQKRDINGCKMYLVKCFNCSGIYDVLENYLLNKISCRFCKVESKNKFFLSEDSAYWIGVTSKNEEFLFSGSKEIVEYIKSNTWFLKGKRYVVNTKGERLNRVVMNVSDPKIFINHLGSNTLDNRFEKLSISDCKDNTKERKRKNDKIVGLIKSKHGKYYCRLQLNEVRINLPHKYYNEALIDLLIAQRKYGFRHNENLYYLLNDVDKDYIVNIEKLCDEKHQKYLNKSRKITFKNKVEIEKDYAKVYDLKNNFFIVDIDSLEKIKNGNWSCYYKKQDKKWYVKGRIVINNKIKQVLLHRYLKSIVDNKYSLIFIDHLDGNGLNNKMENLVYTNAYGNSVNTYGNNVRLLSTGRYQAHITIKRKHHSKTFNTYEEAKDWYKNQKEILMDNRLIFKSIEEVKNFIK